MALRVVTMSELRFEVIRSPELTGETIRAVCKRYGISPDTFYRYLKRFRAEGMQGLEDQSRRPKRQPRRMAADLESTICTMRTEHPRWGARRIHGELIRHGMTPPVPSAIHQALLRNGLVERQPRKPLLATRRFERPVGNDLWQIDATELRLASGRKVAIFDLLDDHSRFLLSIIAVAAPTAPGAWSCFKAAAERYGLPRQVLSDNGLVFTGRSRGVRVKFETRLEQLGVEMINAGPYHPQTLGKLERFHRTLKEWLADEPTAETLEILNRQLSQFQQHYNFERPHQGINNQLPVDRYHPTPVKEVLDLQPAATTRVRAGYRKVGGSGLIGFNNKLITVGTIWVGAEVQVHYQRSILTISYQDQILRKVRLTKDRRFYPMGVRPKTKKR